MTQHVPAKKEVSVKDLAQTILKGSVPGKDSIISYISTSKLHFEDVRSLLTILRKKGPQSQELMDLLVPHRTLKSLNREERALFYYGYIHPILINAAITSIYHQLIELQNEQVSDDVEKTLIYLSRACASKENLETTTKQVLKAFGEARDLEHFSLLIRPFFFTTDAKNKGKHTALLAIANKLKTKTSTRDLAVSLIGIWFQTKTNPISLRRISLLKSVWDIQAMLEQSKTSTAQPLELARILWHQTKDIMHGNVRAHK